MGVGYKHRKSEWMSRLPQAPGLTSRKQSSSSENSGRLPPTAATISSRVSTGFAQRVCVNFLNSGWTGERQDVWSLPERKGG